MVSRPKLKGAVSGTERLLGSQMWFLLLFGHRKLIGILKSAIKLIYEINSLIGSDELLAHKQNHGLTFSVINVSCTEFPGETDLLTRIQRPQ